ncbi:MAG: hypothetical protein Q4F31_10090 [Eubacteriales bacterium]|nr:hypothetical protein [Eubacteriales bacterium]
MDDSKNQERNTANNDPAQETAGEVPATVTDGTEAAAEAAEMIGEAERAAALEEQMNREFLPADEGSGTEGQPDSDEGTSENVPAETEDPGAQNPGTEGQTASTDPGAAPADNSTAPPADGAAQTGPNPTGKQNTVPAIGSDMAGLNGAGVSGTGNTAGDGTVPAAEPNAMNTENAPPGRDRAAEFAELTAAHPEIVGANIPDDIFNALMRSDQHPLRVYESMMLQKQTERIALLESEIAQLRQNAETAVRAPVVGAAGAPVAAEPEDDFLRGFNSYR